MLFTRCPDCDTTFRVTDDALKKANGQVRCGRCASVFNAYAERRDGPADTDTPAPPSDAADPAAAPTEEPASADAEASGAASAQQPASKSPPLPSVKIAHTLHLPRREMARHGPAVAENAEPDPPTDDAFDSMSVADVVAQIELGAADEAAATGEMQLPLDPPGDPESISPTKVLEVLGGDDPSIRTWHLIDEPDTHDSDRRARIWKAGTGLALVALAVQGIHHYRADLAANAALGPLVQSTYSILGATVVPHWDVKQYEILDWIATAEPNARGTSSLRITARIKNRGPLYQPYPSVHLRLKDRWEEAVGSRVFAPAEYLAAAPRKLMAPGETTRAELEIVDPGQDAYGFELDVCIEVETRALSCGSDKVFL
jgi:predicted Zn finger-like uncharacterized protein